MIEEVGASVISLSPYSPDFNPIEMWWSQLKSFLRMFAPTTTEMLDRIIAVARIANQSSALEKLVCSLLLLYPITAEIAVSIRQFS